VCVRARQPTSEAAQRHGSSSSSISNIYIGLPALSSRMGSAPEGRVLRMRVVAPCVQGFRASLHLSDLGGVLYGGDAVAHCLHGAADLQGRPCIHAQMRNRVAQDGCSCITAWCLRPLGTGITNRFQLRVCHARAAWLMRAICAVTRLPLTCKRPRLAATGAPHSGRCDSDVEAILYGPPCVCKFANCVFLICVSH
jgi:hypothetical protein